MKTLFKYMLSVCIVLCTYSLITPANAMYAEPFTFDESTGTITDCEKSVSGRLEVPSEINGHMVTTIGNQAFRQCYQLTEIVLPDTITRIDSGAFAYCESLKSVTLPSSIQYYNCAFGGCANLMEINVNNANPYFCSVNGVLFSKDRRRLIEYPCGKQGGYQIPFGVEVIGESAFEWRSKLSAISVPQSVKTIETNAFLKCFNVTNIYYQGSKEQWNAIQIGDYNQWNKTVIIQYNIDLGAGNVVDVGDMPSSWAVEEIEKARENRLIPVNLDEAYQNNITRQEFCQLAVKVLEAVIGRPIDDILDYHDISINEFQFDDTNDKSILAMYALHVVSGVEERKFEPNRAIEREEAATMLTRLAKVLNANLPSDAELSFSDKNLVSEWAYYSVMFVSNIVSENNKAIMNGTAEKTFSPQETYTREQAFLSFGRLYEALLKCSIAQMRIEHSVDKNKVEIQSRSNYLTDNYFSLKDNHRILWMSHDSSGDGAYDEILVYTPNGYLQNDEFEMWVRPIGDNDIPVWLNGPTEGSIHTHGTGAALVTVQSPISGTLWETFYVYSCDITSQFLLGTRVPEAITERQKTNFYTAGMYVENYSVEANKSSGEWHVKMDVYNVASIYGSVDIYDKDNHYIRSVRIEKNKALPENLPDVASDAWGLISDLFDGDVLTYRQDSSSTPSSLDFYVPEGGYIIFSNNVTESLGATVYNFTDFFIEGISTTVKGLSLSDKNWETLANSFSEGLLEALKEKCKNFAEDESLNFLEWVNANYNTTNFSKYMQDLVDNGLNEFNSMDIDVINIFMKSLSDVASDEIVELAETAFENAMGTSGAVLKGLFYVSDLGNYAVQLDHFSESPETKPIHIIYPTSME